MKVQVTTGSRLHFGLICSSPEAGWQFGGIGLMLREPAWSLTVRRNSSSEDQIIGGRETTGRTQEFLSFLRQNESVPTVDVTFHQEVPFHAGLGGGTQLGLALAAAAELISGRSDCHDPWRLAQLAHRAERSAVGTAGFRTGGFLIDRGQSATVPEHERVQRISVPDHWRFLLIRPVAAQGLSGDRERQFFNRRLQMPSHLVAQLVDEIESTMIPAIQSENFNVFSASLQKYGDAVGTFYASEQGDIFAHPAIRHVVRHLRSQGVFGAAQSSWGPGICVPARSQEHAESIAQMVPPSVDGTTIITSIAEPLNTGASVRFTAPESRSLL